MPAIARPKPSRRPRALTFADVEALRTAATRFGGDAEAGKAAVLASTAACALADPRVLVAHHDALLFLLAYPGSAAVRGLAERELDRIAEAADVLLRERPASRRVLDGSGLANTEVTAAFSLSLARWLATRRGAHAEVTSFGEPSRVAPVLALCLPAMEAETVAAGEDGVALLDALRGGNRTRLQTLVAALDRLPAPAAVRDDLVDSMQPFVTIRPGRRSTLSRTFARAPAAAPFVHEAPLERSLVDPAAAIASPLPPPEEPAARERRAWVDLARGTLAMLARETDPVTWPSVDGVRVYDLGRGARLALYPMHASRRFALDSHTGYLLVKNGVPVAYGGGWPFLAVCRTGINVFAPFRGGESSWLFARTLAAYRQHFGVRRFVVEPYQFGAGNREGLTSGAFWFYYRLGFRPVDAGVARLAARESARLARRGRRPDLATMRALTGSDLALDVGPSSPEERTEPADLSRAATRRVVRVHGGDRRRALRDDAQAVADALGARDLARWPRAEREAFASLSLVFAAIPDLARWGAQDRAECVALMRAKGADDDAAFARGLASHVRLPAALARIAAEAQAG